jgi:hypothetical protein
MDNINMSCEIWSSHVSDPEYYVMSGRFRVVSDESAASIFMIDDLDGDEGSRFLRNVGNDVPRYTVSYSRRDY